MTNLKIWELINEAYSKFLATFEKYGDIDAVYFILEEIGDREELSERQFDFMCDKVYGRIPFF